MTTNIRPLGVIFRALDRRLALVCFALALANGCYAPLHSPGVPASSLPDSFRIPTRSVGEPLNYSSLAMTPPDDYILGPDDILEVVVDGLYPNGDLRPVRAQVMASGEIHLPLVGAVHVGGLNLMQAHLAVTGAFANGYIKEPRTNVYLVQPSTTNVMVMGEVGAPGVYALPKYENDIAHALAMAGGIGNDADNVIELHRRVSFNRRNNQLLRQQIRDAESGAIVEISPPTTEELPTAQTEGPEILRVPLRGFDSSALTSDDVKLNIGDVVVVPSRKHEVFYVVGKLSPTNFIRFSSALETRDLGIGFLLPRDRDIDVVTAVVMAGYIDPIDSPTTVTVQRPCHNGESLLIHVDLIKARCDSRETVLVQAGDIIYLNPDGHWWFRRTLDRVIPELLLFPYERSALKWFGQDRN